MPWNRISKSLLRGVYRVTIFNLPSCVTWHVNRILQPVPRKKRFTRIRRKERNPRTTNKSKAMVDWWKHVSYFIWGWYSRKSRNNPTSRYVEIDDRPNECAWSARENCKVTFLVARITLFPLENLIQSGNPSQSGKQGHRKDIYKPTRDFYDHQWLGTKAWDWANWYCWKQIYWNQIPRVWLS